MDINLLEENLVENEEEISTEATLTRVEYSSGYEKIPNRGGINFRKIVRYVVYVVIGLLPIFFLPWNSELVEVNKQALLIFSTSLILVLYMIDIVQRGVARIRISKLFMPLGVFLGISLITAIFSKNIYQSLLGNAGSPLVYSFATIFSLAILFFVAINVIEDDGVILRRLVISSFGLAFLWSALQILGVHLVDIKPYNNFYFNTIGSINSLAMLAGVLWPMLWSDEWSLGRYFRPGRIVSILGLFLIILVNWWLVWTVSFVSILAWIMFKSLETGRSRISISVVPMSVIVIGIFMMLIGFSVPVLKARLPIEVSPSYRASFEIALKSLRESPIWGYGQNNFIIAYEKYRPVSIAGTIFSDTRFPQAASGVLTLAVEGGILLVLGFVFLAGYILRELYYSRNSNVFLVVSSLSLFVLFSSNITSLAVLFIGLIILELNSARIDEKVLELENSHSYSLISSAVFIVSVVMVLIGSYFAVIRHIGDIHYARALTSTETDMAVGGSVKAIKINNQDSRYYQLLSRALILKLGEELNNKDKNIKVEDKNQNISNLAASAVDAALRATEISPHDSQNWLNRAVVYQSLIGLVNDADKTAIDMMGEVLKRNPNSPAAYQSLGLIYFSLGEYNANVINRANQQEKSKLTQKDLKVLVSDKFENAEKNYLKAIELNPNLGQAVYDLGVVYDRQGKLKDAVKQFEKLVNANRNNAGLAFTLGLLYYRDNQKEAAFNLFQKAVSLAPNYSNSLWYLSLLQEERGDLDGALVNAEKILKLNPDNTEVGQRVDQLRAGTRLIPPGKVLNQKPL